MRRENGFTLVELLVAMVAGALLLATLSWSVASLGRELRAERSAKPFEEIQAIAPILTELIESSHPVRPGGAGIVAERDRYQAVTRAPAALGAAGPMRMTLSVRRLTDGTALEIAMAPADLAIRLSAAVTQPRILAAQLADIRMDYLPADKPDLPPRLVTIRFTDSKGRTTRIAAAPKLNAQAACRFDPISMSCRP